MKMLVAVFSLFFLTGALLGCSGDSDANGVDDKKEKRVEKANASGQVALQATKDLASDYGVNLTTYSPSLDLTSMSDTELKGVLKLIDQVINDGGYFVSVCEESQIQCFGNVEIKGYAENARMYKSLVNEELRRRS